MTSIISGMAGAVGTDEFDVVLQADSLWIVIVVAAFFLGFVVGYSQKHEMKAGVGAGAPAGGGYGK